MARAQTSSTTSGNHQKDPRKITIMGAGLVGCLWAHLLRLRGFEVDVFEKRGDLRTTSTYSGRSINLILTSRGMKALRAAGLEKEALALSTPVYGRMIHPLNGDLQLQPYGLEQERNLSISRKDLNLFLLEAAARSGARFHFEHSLEDIDLIEKNLIFSGGRRASFDLLFGTDGAGSQVRKALTQKKPEIFQERMEWLGADYKELFIPAGSSLKKDCLHIWPRGSHMMMALMNKDQSWTVTLYLPSGGPRSFETLQSPAQVEAFFQTEFPDALPEMPTYQEDYQSHPQSRLGTLRCSPWIWGDSVALMGDAAHAIVPFFGQGANAGFEDCTELLKAYDNFGNWGQALQTYNESQRPNGQAIADMAIENWREMSERVADPQFLLRKKVESVLEKNYPQLFKSRYGMVTYTLIPYSLVKKAGEVQETLFKEICAPLKSIDDLNLEEAHRLLQKIYVPFLKEQGLSLERFPF
jgi:kynurenine 3-monooxygenase